MDGLLLKQLECQKRTASNKSAAMVMRLMFSFCGVYFLALPSVLSDCLSTLCTYCTKPAVVYYNHKFYGKRGKVWRMSADATRLYGGR